MSESSTPEHQLSAPGVVPLSFWADPIAPTSAAGGPDAAGSGDADSDEAEASDADAEPEAGGSPDGSPGDARDGTDRAGDDGASSGAGDASGGDSAAGDASGGDSAAGDASDSADDPESLEDSESPGTPARPEKSDGADGADGADDAGDEKSDEPGETDESDETDEEEEQEDETTALRRRFAELVEERVRRARYAHHLTRPVFTPAESAMATLVERRASVWVPTLTFVATIVSAIAAVVLATRLRSDPTDPSGKQLIVVTVTVCLLATAFATLLRAEVHYERMRPRGRVVRHDVADAYELVRDAPRRMMQNDVPLLVLRRVAALLPAAEQLVDALAAYAADGGSRVRAHPAYERIIRMRAEVEALEVMLEELDKSAAAEPVHGVDAPLPLPHQVADYDGLADLAEALAAEG